jgi:hypothetical protein
MTENSTVQLLRVKGIDSSTAFLATYGLYFFAGFGGLLCGIQLFNVFGLPLSLKQSAVGLVPLILSAFLLYMKMNKK